MTDTTIEGILAVITAGGTLISLLVFLCIGTILLLMPIACTIDVAVSKSKDGATKAVLIILFFITGGLFAIPYGLFFAETKWLRVLSGLSVLVGIITLIGSCTLFLGVHSAAAPIAERKRQEKVGQFEKAVQAFTPEVLAVSEIAQFKAITNAVADKPYSERLLVPFSLEGPKLSEAIQIDRSLRAVTQLTTKGDMFAISNHEVGVVSPASGEFLKFDVKDTLPDFSWPKGISYDMERGRVLVLCSHVYNRLFSLDLERNTWEELSKNRSGDSLQGLAHFKKTDELISLVLPYGSQEISKLARFNMKGALIGHLSLAPPIPVDDKARDAYYQLTESSGRIMLVAPGLAGGEARVFAIDGQTGTVFSAKRN